MPHLDADADADADAGRILLRETLRPRASVDVGAIQGTTCVGSEARYRRKGKRGRIEKGYYLEQLGR